MLDVIVAVGISSGTKETRGGGEGGRKAKRANEQGGSSSPCTCTTATTIQFGALHQRRLTISRLRWYVLGAEDAAAQCLYASLATTVCATWFNYPLPPPSVSVQTRVHLTRKRPLETRNWQLETRNECKSDGRAGTSKASGYVLSQIGASLLHDPSYLDLSDLSDFSGRYRPCPPPALFPLPDYPPTFLVSPYFPPRYLPRVSTSLPPPRFRSPSASCATRHTRASSRFVCLALHLGLHNSTFHSRFERGSAYLLRKQR